MSSDEDKDEKIVFSICEYRGRVNEAAVKKDCWYSWK